MAGVTLGAGVSDGAGVGTGGVVAAGGNIPALVWATWNPDDKAATIQLSPDLLTTSAASGGSWGSARATQGISAGKWYFEILVTNTDSGDGPLVGLCLSTTPLNAFNPTNSCTVRADLGWLVSNGVFAHQNVGVGGTHGATVRFAVDLDAGKAWISGAASDVWFNSGDPVSGVNPQVLFTPNTEVFVLSGHYETDSTAVANFGQSAFLRAVPTGYTAGWGA